MTDRHLLRRSMPRTVPYPTLGLTVDCPRLPYPGSGGPVCVTPNPRCCVTDSDSLRQSGELGREKKRVCVSHAFIAHVQQVCNTVAYMLRVITYVVLAVPPVKYNFNNFSARPGRGRLAPDAAAAPGSPLWPGTARLQHVARLKMACGTGSCRTCERMSEWAQDFTSG